jgi:hypothetical protein
VQTWRTRTTHLPRLIGAKGSEEAFSHAVRYFDSKIRCESATIDANTAQDLGSKEAFSSFSAATRTGSQHKPLMRNANAIT